MCNTAVERAALDPGSQKYVVAYLERLQTAFRGALENARRAGDVRSEPDLDGLAAYLTTSLIGVAACVRAEAPPEVVKSACDVITSNLWPSSPEGRAEAGAARGSA